MHGRLDSKKVTVANGPSGVPAAPPEKARLVHAKRALCGWTFVFLHTRGIKMENDIKIKPKLNINLSKTIKTNTKANTTTKSKTPDMELESQIFGRSVSTPRSPTSKRAEARTELRQVDQQVPLLDLGDDSNSATSEENFILGDIKNERTELEEFLFNDSNKITKSAIKYILNKWSYLETKLYEDRLELEKLKLTCSKTSSTMTYANVASGPVIRGGPSMKPETEKNISKSKHEVILIKPVEEKDGRNNEQIKDELVKKLGKVRKDLRINNIRQMRGKGIIIEVKDKKDVETIRKVDLEGIGLKAGKPNKVNPSIIIYDVEPGCNVDQLKEDFVNKNCDFLNTEQLQKVDKEIEFRYSFKTPKSKINWIVQVPGTIFESLIDRGRIYMLWRSYRIREYLNIMRCFKCHGYGHKAVNCGSMEQLCENCGDREHLKNSCPKKDAPRCINCIRSRRKDIVHRVKDVNCPEYKRQIEIYRSKIKW